MGSIAIGESGLQIVRFGAGQARVTGILRADGHIGMTHSAFSSGPPASPQDGDIWIADVDTTNGVKWMFQYRSASASARKWEFIGGAPLRASVTAYENPPVNNAWCNLTTDGPSITVGRDGDYLCEFNATPGAVLAGTSARSAQAQCGVAFGDTTPPNPTGHTFLDFVGLSSGITGVGTISGRAVMVASASTILKMRYNPMPNWATTEQGWQNRFLRIIPFRVS